MKKYMVYLLLFIGMGRTMHANAFDDRDIKQFNTVLLRHVQGIGYALACPEIYKKVDLKKGLAAWWQALLIKGGLYALLQDKQLVEQTYAFHEIAKKDEAYQEALAYARSLEERGATGDEIRNARYHADILYITAQMKMAQEQGCVLNRPAGFKTLDRYSPETGGTMVATAPENWGDLAYLAGLFDANAGVDYNKYNQILSMIALGQLMAWHEKG